MQVERGIQESVMSLLESLERNGYPVCACRTAVYSGMISVPRFGRMARVRFHTGRKGWPDITACVAGKFVAIEVKTGTGTQSREQKLIQKNVEQQGGLYWVVRSRAECERLLAGVLEGYSPAGTDGWGINLEDLEN